MNDYNTDDVDYNILMMLGTTQSTARGCHLMYLVGVVLDHGAHILVDTGTKHHIIDINFTRLISLLEQHINTTILVGSSTEVS
jgi:hypothetical protein